MCRRTGEKRIHVSRRAQERKIEGDDERGGHGTRQRRTRQEEMGGEGNIEQD